jgi:hypothetical protein
MSRAAEVNTAAINLLDRIDGGQEPSREELKAAVKESLAHLVEIAPGRAVEVRIPPFAAVQAVEGRAHRRGTPSAVVETDAVTWLKLVVGRLSWQEAVASGRLQASGERSDLSPLLPLLSGPNHRVD